jgi:hypothetical protein
VWREVSLGEILRKPFSLFVGCIGWIKGKYNRVALIFWFCSTKIGLLGCVTDSSAVAVDSAGFSLSSTTWLPIISIGAEGSSQFSAFGSGAIPNGDETQVRDEFLDYRCDIDQHLFVYATSRIPHAKSSFRWPYRQFFPISHLESGMISNDGIGEDTLVDTGSIIEELISNLIVRPCRAVLHRIQTRRIGTNL